MADDLDTNAAASDKRPQGQITLVLQGGGALGAYQAGVYQALHEADVEPHWVIGTSIGAINAALIAGNPPAQRLARLREFWNRMRHTPWAQWVGAAPVFGARAAHAMTMIGGIKGFFEPNPLAWLGPQATVGAEAAAYYRTNALEQTLLELVDFDLINHGPTRLAVGVAHVQSGEMRYFDSRETPITARHIMASGALPPAFPAVRIDGELYWDGGILSNTPVEAVFDDNPRHDGVVFAVHLWTPNGPEPGSLLQVAARQKDLQYASRAKSHITRQRQIHQLRRIIAELGQALPDRGRNNPEITEMLREGCMVQVHVVRLLAPNLEDEDHMKDIDFSVGGIRSRWDAGFLDTSRVLVRAPWTHPHDPHEGFHLHEARAGEMMPDNVLS
jgi:NTE family protein